MNILSPETRLYKLPVPIIGLTGGIATGKSSVSKILIEKKMPLIDADLLVKKIYQSQEAKLLIQKLCPSCIQNELINFKELRKLFFSNKNIKESIENFIYPQLEKEFYKEYLTLNSPPFVIYDAPLLLEKGMEAKVDLSILVYAPRPVQKERLINRDQVSEEQAEVVLNEQINIELKKNKVDYILDNSSDYSSLENKVNKLITWFQGELS